ncbi:microsomal glutathione S-transferase 3-like [Chlorella sorokiniana]|uniref:Microsomal glutathione S-transferase 3-like n=1 Tax=Chlorella sorokiniana TaxID=3076 RepID=A0A2P6TR27_CHLSO|nr:microsomal glutathione S-transferase 3-like [Chlorella sorokiniana]|eukprot:PRW56516.1 microsomal glutathione S-transferase 3-like [Chlorella sorokiniana]
MGGEVNRARKRLNVPYPIMYAPPGHPHEREFNCIQRGHQNSLEVAPAFLICLLVAGLRFPTAAALAGVVFLAARYSYFKGYCTGDPAARLRGISQLWVLAAFAVLGMIAAWAAELMLVPTGGK